MSVLPPMRRELRVYPGPAHAHGAPTWTIHDPVRQRFFRIGWVERIVMDYPDCPPDVVVQRVRSQGGPLVSPSQVVVIRSFFLQNELVSAADPVVTRALIERRRKQTHGWIRQLWHGWLFFRVPLWNPDPFLRRLTWFWRLLGHPLTLWGLVFLAATGAVNTVRNWDTFLTTFPHFFSMEGWLWYGGAILGAKFVHELGHAVTASRMGCRVPTMGVAFMLLWPVFYTDVSEVWTLRSQKHRLLVGSGGVLAELGLAAIASFLWPFLPEGPARSAMVLLAGIVWIGTVVINLNPFMRFDGYFLLSDALGIANLQQQAYALGQWRMREWLFGWGVPPPPVASFGPGAVLTWFAYVSWIYRAFLFLGFALLVYFLLFRVAGVLMLMAEVGWFILRPVTSEVGVWWRNRRLFHWNLRLVVTLLVVVGGVAVITLVPWEGSVRVASMARAGWYQPLFAPVPARVVSLNVEQDQTVSQDQDIVVLQAPDLDLSLEQNRLKIERLQWELAHGGSQFSMGDNRLVVQRELSAAFGERHGLLKEQGQLRMRAPFAGVVKFVAEGLEPGVWVDHEHPLVAVLRLQPVRVEAYVPEGEIGRLTGLTHATFFPSDPALPVRELKVDRTESQAIEFIQDPAFASPFGGPLAARQDRKGRLVPERACFRVWLSPMTPWLDLVHTQPGTVRFIVPPRTVLERLWHPVWAALIRQTDF